MAEKDLEADDPMEFVAIRYPVPEGVDGDEVMARCFIEEYALMGMPRERVFHLFKSRFFSGTHAIFDTRGEAFVRGIIDDVYGAAPSQGVSDGPGL
jgi:hypothetical protein